nr:DUF6624 domain-containing protein [uncultured Dyadobacter sp.]
MDIYLANSMRREQLAHQLIQMAARDLDVCEKLRAANKLAPGYNPVMEAVHRQNANQLREIIAEIGWPTHSKVGEQASEAAWLIVQHAIGEPAFMKGCYTLMQLVASDINPANLAQLHDRICYFNGHPQRYGTQYDGECLYPVEDANNLHDLRDAMQLPPVSTDKIITGGRFDNGTARQDLHTDPTFNEWRKKAGWI